MNGIKREAASGRVRIAVGAAQVHDVPPEVASAYHGPVESVIRQYADQNITDPVLRASLRELLADPSCVYEFYLSTPEGKGEERPLSPSAEWDEVVRTAQNADVEVGVARAHRGGWTRT